MANRVGDSPANSISSRCRPAASAVAQGDLNMSILAWIILGLFSWIHWKQNRQQERRRLAARPGVGNCRRCCWRMAFQHLRPFRRDWAQFVQLALRRCGRCGGCAGRVARDQTRLNLRLRTT